MWRLLFLLTSCLLLSRAFSQCGIRNEKGVEDPKIIVDDETLAKANEHTRDTFFGEWSHMCAVQRVINLGILKKQIYLSGGSLIAPNVILTAAHYVTDVTPSDVSVRCGEWNTETVPENHKFQDRNAASIMIHPEFQNETNFNDFAVIVLKEDFDTSVSHIGEICLPSQNDDQDISLEGCFATGWGKDRFGRKGEYKTVMKQVQLNMVESKEKCQEELRKTRLTKFFKLDKSFTCAGGEDGVDLCTGDGGGPLVCPKASNPKQYVQTGITSWGIECGKKDVPGVYADVKEGLCFIDYATRCGRGVVEAANYNSPYGFKGCANWAEDTYCKYKKELEGIEDKIQNAKSNKDKFLAKRRGEKLKVLLETYKKTSEEGCKSTLDLDNYC